MRRTPQFLAVSEIAQRIKVLDTDEFASLRKLDASPVWPNVLAFPSGREESLDQDLGHAAPLMNKGGHITNVVLDLIHQLPHVDLNVELSYHFNKHNLWMRGDKHDDNVCHRRWCLQIRYSSHQTSAGYH